MIHLLFWTVSVLFLNGILVGVIGDYKAAQTFIQSQELEEVYSKLLKYDIDEDGQLSEEEIALGKPQIQEYLDKYSELSKQQMNAEVGKAPKDNTPATPIDENNYDADDGVEIEVEGDIEYVEDDNEKIHSYLLAQCLVGALVGIVTVGIYYCCQVRKIKMKEMAQQQQELMAQKRAAWLEKLSQTQSIISQNKENNSLDHQGNSNHQKFKTDKSPRESSFTSFSSTTAHHQLSALKDQDIKPPDPARLNTSLNTSDCQLSALKDQDIKPPDPARLNISLSNTTSDHQLSALQDQDIKPPDTAKLNTSLSSTSDHQLSALINQDIKPPDPARLNTSLSSTTSDHQHSALKDQDIKSPDPSTTSDHQLSALKDQDIKPPDPARLNTSLSSTTSDCQLSALDQDIKPPDPSTTSDHQLSALKDQNIKPPDPAMLNTSSVSSLTLNSKENNSVSIINQQQNSSVTTLPAESADLTHSKLELKPDHNLDSSHMVNSTSNAELYDLGSGQEVENVEKHIASVAQNKNTNFCTSQSEETISSSSVNVAVTTAPAVKMQKTADREKTIRFLEDVLSCTVILQEKENFRTRYGLGKLTVSSLQFPKTAEEVESKMVSLVHEVFVRQVKKVNFAITAYNACKEFSATYNDTLVDATSNIVKKEALDSLISCFRDENSGATSPDEDLWSSYGDGSSHSFETHTFLPRLVNQAQDGANVSQALLIDLLKHDQGELFLKALLCASGNRLAAVKRLDELILSENVTLGALDVLISNPMFGEVLGNILAKEIEEATKHSLGNYFEQKSAFAFLLKLSTIPGMTGKRFEFNLKEQATLPFKTLRSYPHLTYEDVRSVQNVIQSGIRRVQQLVYSALKKVVTNKVTREVGLAWIAAVVSLNELRTAAVLQDTEGPQPGCSDGYMTNFSAVILEFFLPIGLDSSKLMKVDLSYSASPACRLNYDYETCLASGQIVSERGHDRRVGVLPTELQGQQTFITECYHLTQRALSIGIIPAIKHYGKMHSFFQSHIQALQGTDREEAMKNMHVLVSVVWETSLLDTELARSITAFYISQASLLLEVVKYDAVRYKDIEEGQRYQRKVLSVVPEFCVKDMAQWFTFLANSILRIHPHAVKWLTLSPFVDCCVMLLERPDLMPGPIPASQIVSALLSFMRSSDSEQSAHSQGWGSGIMSDLAAMVHTCPSAQTKLGPALLRTYISVDVVEGLDVDKDNFDKYSSRMEIGQLVQKLWSRTDCRASIINMCGSELFQNFLGSILDTLLYMLHDSLSRLANVKKIELLKANEGEWSVLTSLEKAQKDQFLRSEESVAKGFMRQAKKTLEFLVLISQSDKVSVCFTHQPLASRAASTINGFLESLCGVKAKDYKVKNMAKYDFQPGELLLSIINFILHITLQDHSWHDGFIVSMVKDPDFELTNLQKAQSVISSKGLGNEDLAQKMVQLIEEMKKLSEDRKSSLVLETQVCDEDDWVNAMVEIEVDPSALEESYTSTMQSLAFSTAFIQDSHSFQSNFQALDPRSPKVKALMKEMKQLQQSLPIHPDAGIFVRQDEDRMDVMRALITGPTGTPYSLGCFCFDIYFPSTYPNAPPLVKIITTGNGTVRFNPNLYADGKVCLSLLGTWHAGDASEKWTPGKSSLYQVLVSIQSMILTPDPMFNEPGYERLKDTEEGELQSQEYNWKLHLHTLRHAILGQLRNPPPGFKQVIRFHFALQRERVLKQCAQWVKCCKEPDLLKRIRQAADSIFEELLSLEVDFSEKEDGAESDELEDDNTN